MGLNLPSGGHISFGYYSAKKKISATRYFCVVVSVSSTLRLHFVSSLICTDDDVLVIIILVSFLNLYRTKWILKPVSLTMMA